MTSLHIFETAFNAVIPIVLVIAFGYWLKQKGLITTAFVAVGNKIGFQLLIPLMLFMNVYSIESFSAIRWDVVIYCLILEVAIFFFGFFTVGLCTSVYKRRGVLLQNVFRSNTAIVGLSLTAALGGVDAMAVTAVVMAFSQPLLNSMAVIALSIYSDDENQKIDIKAILKRIAANPLIHGILIGMVCLFIRSAQETLFGRVVFTIKDDLKFFYTAINNVKTIASPFMLIILGGQFTFSASKGMLKEIVSGVFYRVVLAPALSIGLAVVLSASTQLIQFGPDVYPALISLFGSPAAVSGAIMAGQMGHDHQLATQLVVWTSVMSVFTIFATVCILMSGGLLAV